ncbi:hypothetical protein GCM10020000_26130 [Streptomyces olivoverticillatus]
MPGGRLGEISGGAMLDSLARLGRTPADIEAVAFTHLHIDHIGWAWLPVPGTGTLAFAHADHLVAEPEWTHRHLLEQHGITKEMTALMEPKVRTVAEGEEIFPGVHVMLTPPATPRATPRTSSRAAAQRLIAFGDAMHSPVQADRPEWPAAVDHDPEEAAVFRRRLVEEMSEPNTLGFGAHFADVVFGRVRTDGEGPAWEPVDA